MYIYCDRPTRASVAAVSENAVHGLKLLYFVCFIHEFNFYTCKLYLFVIRGRFKIKPFNSLLQWTNFL